MKYLIDTDCIVDHLEGRPEAVQLMTSLADDGIAISLITYGEIYEAILYSRRYEYARASFLEFLRGASVVPLTEDIMHRFAGIRGYLRRREQPISDTDILIAATALVLDLTLVTRNQGQFEHINDLRLLPKLT